MRVYKINLIISKLIIIKFSIASGMIISIIQARMGSKRLPGKTLMNIDGKKSVLEVVVNQISESKLVDKIVVATSKSKKDDIIENFCSENHITFFRGNQHNVLDRYFQCAKKFNPDVIVRITADCP